MRALATALFAVIVCLVGNAKSPPATDTVLVVAHTLRTATPAAKPQDTPPCRRPPHPPPTSAKIGSSCIDGTLVHLSASSIKIRDVETGREISFLLVPHFDQVFSFDGKTYQTKDLRQGLFVRVYYDQKLLGARHADRIVLVAAPTPAATRPAATPRPAVHDSLIAMFNDLHPEHVAREPYYGRYSYVLLRDAKGDVQKRNSAFITALVNRYALINTRITVGPPTPTPRRNPWGYNIFFLPAHGGVRDLKLRSDKHEAVNALLYNYASDTARDIRDAYCAVTSHESRSICAVPRTIGPVVLTLIEPLPHDFTNGPFPPAFAADFSAIPAEQFGGAIDIIQRTITVTEPVKGDQVLTPPVAARIASGLDAIQHALTSSFPGLGVWLDSGLLHNRK